MFPTGTCAPLRGKSKGRSKSKSKSKTAYWNKMAIYHFSAQVIGRSSGRSSVAAAAYRLGVAMDDERTGLRHDYTRKGGVDGWEQMTPANAPEWMKDPGACWNSVEKVERRKDSQLCRELNIALPRELTPEQMKDLTREWVGKNCVDKGMVATVAWHHLDSDNPHAHVMLSLRPVEGEGWGKKPQDWNTRKDEMAQWRETWAQEANAALERAGSQERIDHRSLKDQGQEREAQRHMGPKATAMERRGETPARSRYIHPTPPGMGQEQARKDRKQEAAPPQAKQEPAKAPTWEDNFVAAVLVAKHTREEADKAKAEREKREESLRRAREKAHTPSVEALNRQRGVVALAEQKAEHHLGAAVKWRHAHRWRVRFGLDGEARAQDALGAAAVKKLQEEQARLARRAEAEEKARALVVERSKALKEAKDAEDMAQAVAKRALAERQRLLEASPEQQEQRRQQERQRRARLAREMAEARRHAPTMLAARSGDLADPGDVQKYRGPSMSM